MGLFNRGQSQDDKLQTETIKSELAALESRLDNFLAKLNDRIDLLIAGFIAEAPAIMATDDRFGQAYYRFSSGIKGQATNMREKVREVMETQIEPAYSRYSDILSAGSDAYRLVHEWRHRCAEKANNWEDELQHRMDAATEQVERKNYEPIFLDMVNQYMQQCKSVLCTQCGDNLQIAQVYYHSAYVNCPSCNTQNIFEPGVIARDLEQNARKLAEQRSKHFMDAHEQKRAEEEALYQQMHNLQLKMSFQELQAKSGPLYAQLLALNNQRVAAEDEIPAQLDKYYRNIFDELNGLLPDLKEHHEKFFISLQNNYKQYDGKRSINL
ncbi:hypothetical protein [Chitinophaga pinensis]|uniref:Uncharacterized protein n=1 Tax=Chitinophaga pinensis (strain ATCC 43595 / DSM 2588 / LMG 13176 / NBRC 15968 / NCIMB 11800 / UQM 2034) TaxID=485918 RepID=A0A979GAL4_CHIPD|nr:hypothetical protein [Chitinophaga pinensis]ACU63766.1 hypothetical protein Cpin_6362 [Chitinophaga pinensis DSM 2588]